jgi:hypothetical protein
MSSTLFAYELRTQIEKLSHLKVSPDAKIVVQVDLTDRHPLKVCTDCIHLAGVHTNSTKLQEGSLGIVHTAGAISIAVVGNLMVVCEITSVGLSL